MQGFIVFRYQFIMRYFFFLLTIPLLLASCNRDKCGVDVNLNVDQAQLSADIAAIDAYLSQNGIQAQEHPSGLRYVIDDEGDGSRVSLCDNVVVDYQGTLFDGTQFDASNRPVGLSMRSLIEGWKIGIPLIRERGEVRLYIPSVYAYGANGRNNIPPNANLIFDIQLYVVQ